MEKYVELERDSGIMRGMLHLPESADNKRKVPGVVLYHGFTGNRMEPGFMFVRFSRLLAENGIASVRFDFLHSGESDGSFEKMTLSGELADAQAVLDYFSSLDMIDTDNIFLLGLSMGGSIAGYTAGRNPDRIKGLLLWAAAGEMSMFIEKREKEIEEGKITGNPMDMGGLIIGEQFLQDVKSLEIMKTSAKYKGPAVIIHGTGDETVPYSIASEYKKLYGNRASLTLIEGADHTFQGAEWSSKLFSLTLKFIQSYSEK